MEQNNFFDSIGELNKRIGKFVIFRYDGGLYAKLLTKIEITKNNSKMEGHKIWGKFLVGISSSGKLSVYNFSPRGETYGVYQYARDPTEKEIKLIRKKLREIKFREFLIKSKL
jgi:hypothetical protein